MLIFHVNKKNIKCVIQKLSRYIFLFDVFLYFMSLHANIGCHVETSRIYANVGLI